MPSINDTTASTSTKNSPDMSAQKDAPEIKFKMRRTQAHTDLASLFKSSMSFDEKNIVKRKSDINSDDQKPDASDLPDHITQHSLKRSKTS